MPHYRPFSRCMLTPNTLCRCDHRMCIFRLTPEVHPQGHFIRCGGEAATTVPLSGATRVTSQLKDGYAAVLRDFAATALTNSCSAVVHFSSSHPSRSTSLMFNDRSDSTCAAAFGSRCATIVFRT